MPGHAVVAWSLYWTFGADLEIIDRRERIETVKIWPLATLVLDPRLIRVGEELSWQLHTSLALLGHSQKQPCLRFSTKIRRPNSERSADIIEPASGRQI